MAGMAAYGRTDRQSLMLHPGVTDQILEIAMSKHCFGVLPYIGGLLCASMEVKALEFTAISAGGAHTCAITDQARLMCWGDNTYGQLGTGGNEGTALPTFVPGLFEVSAVAAAGTHTCAIASDRLYCWGDNSQGQLGIGLVDGAAVPELVSFPGLPVGALVSDLSVAPPDYGSSYYGGSCAVVEGGAWCWGEGGYGQLGDGGTQDSFLPRQVDPGEIPQGVAITAVASSASEACALTASMLWCWGAFDIAGWGVTSPIAVPMPAAVTAVAGGMFHSCAVAGGKIYCWGGNAHGELGTGNTVASYGFPRKVVSTLLGQNVESITTGYAHTCAIRGDDGKAFCWGADTHGQLGNDYALADRLVPTAVAYLSDMTALSAGGEHTCGIAGGIAYCWGSNEHRQLGSGNDMEHAQVPLAVSVDHIFDSGFD